MTSSSSNDEHQSGEKDQSWLAAFKQPQPLDVSDSDQSSFTNTDP